MIICKLCQEEFESIRLLASHIRFAHNLSSYEYGLKYNYNGVTPKCECGCNKETKWISLTTGFNKLINGHYAKKEIDIKICQHCGSEFSKPRAKYYCSHKCQFAANVVHNPDVFRICESCGKVFKLHKNKNQKFCGYKCVQKSESTRNKMKETSLKRYGVDNIFKSDVFKENLKKHNLEKYGVEYNTQAQEVIDKGRQTKRNRDKESKELSSKHLTKINFSRFYDKLINSDRLKKLVTPLFDVSEYKGVFKKHLFKCNECETEFESTLLNRVPRCPTCFPICPKTSKLEVELQEFIQKLIPNENINYNDREILNGDELDVFIPNLKIAFEFNGDYWHSTQQKVETYHKDKSTKCDSIGVKLFHIFEHDWITKPEIVKSIIRFKLNLIDLKIGARETIIRTISPKQANQFLEINHLRGYQSSKINYGLFYKDELVSAMSFKKSNKVYEIVQFASKLNIIVVGGFSKLLSKFKKDFNPNSIISYVDRDYFDGKVYEYNNFKLHKIIDNYFYVKKYIRYTKQTIKNEIIRFDDNLTEQDDTHPNGYFTLYGSGEYCLVWRN